MTSATLPRADHERRHAPAGFTLIELLVVLALLGVLAGMIAPRFGGTTRAMQTEEAAQSLRSALERCRVDAARRAQRIEIEFAPDGRPELSVDAFAPARHPAWDFTPLAPAATRTVAARSTLRFEFEGTIESEPRHLVFHADGRSTEASIRVEGTVGGSFVLTVRPDGIQLDRREDGGGA